MSPGLIVPLATLAAAVGALVAWAAVGVYRIVDRTRWAHSTSEPTVQVTDADLTNLHAGIAQLLVHAAQNTEGPSQ